MENMETVPNSGQKHHVPERTCVICRRKYPKGTLARYVRGLDGTPIQDSNQILEGRGFYVCPDPICRERFENHGTRKRSKGGRH